jgi:hypothetical protein
MLFYADTLNSLKTLAQVQAVGFTSRVPLSHIGASGQSIDAGDAKKAMLADVIEVGGNYYQAIGASFLSGKAPPESTSLTDEWIVVVTDSVARRLWPNGDAVGQTLRINRGRTRRVVGIVRPLEVTGLGSDFPGQIFVPHTQPVFFIRDDLSILMRLRRGTSVSLREIQSRLDSVDRGAIVERTRSGSELLSVALRPLVSQTLLTVALGVAMLLLSCVGVFGSVRQWLSVRQKEMRIRVMLGATPAVLVARTLWNAASLLAGGALIGVLLAFWTVHLVGTGVLRVELAFADIVPGLTGAVLIVLVVSYIGASRVALDLMERRL